MLLETQQFPVRWRTVFPPPQNPKMTRETLEKDSQADELTSAEQTGGHRGAATSGPVLLVCGSGGCWGVKDLSFRPG